MLRSQQVRDPCARTGEDGWKGRRSPALGRWRSDGAGNKNTEVTWLCKRHHEELHAAERQANLEKTLAFIRGYVRQNCN